MHHLLILALAAATASAQAPAPAYLEGHLMPAERANLARVQRIHEPGLGLISRLRDSGLLDAQAVWWVAGPRDVLPFAGEWKGLDGVAEFQKHLDATMKYTSVTLKRYLVSGDDVAAIFVGEGTARATGRPFKSEIVRLYTFRDGKIVEVRNYFDTAAYVAAVRP